MNEISVRFQGQDCRLHVERNGHTALQLIGAGGDLVATATTGCPAVDDVACAPVDLVYIRDRSGFAGESVLYPLVRAGVVEHLGFFVHVDGAQAHACRLLVGNGRG